MPASLELRPVGLISRCGNCGALLEGGAVLCPDGLCENPEERRHKKLLAMLGHVKDALRLDPLVVYRAAALAGYNANPKPSIHNARPGLKALWAAEDADAMLGVASDEGTGE